MISLRIVEIDGTIREITVMQAEFVRICPHCDERFFTCDPDQMYPNVYHKQRAYIYRRILKETTPSLSF